MTRITNGEMEEPTTPDCVDVRPEIVAGGPGVPVAANVTGVTPAAEALTLAGPASGPSVKATAARPAMSVTTVPAERVPPPLVTANVMGIPDEGLPEALAKATVRGFASG
ncbi:MAG: hypothetical protein ACAI25_04555 [Planctomycetota bacterium]